MRLPAPLPYTTLFRSAASLYPILYRLEAAGKIRGRWVERAGQRRRRYYRLMASGRHALASRRKEWLSFVRALERVRSEEHTSELQSPCKLVCWLLLVI